MNPYPLHIERVVNLTGHPVNVESTTGWPVARLPADDKAIRAVKSVIQVAEVHWGGFKVPLLEYREVGVVEWPEEQDGVMYVVSNVVSGLVPAGRVDIVSVGKLDRSKDFGTVARAFVRLRRRSTDV